MKYVWSKKLVNFMQLIRVFFKRILILAAVIAFGSAMLSIYSTIDFIKRMTGVLKGNPSVVTTPIIVLGCILAASYAIEKGLNLYIQQK